METLLIATPTGRLEAVDITWDESDPGPWFDDLSRRVAHAWCDVSIQRSRPTADLWLEQLVYDFFHSKLVHQLEKEEEVDALLDARIAAHHRGRRGLEVSPNLFQRALLALFAHEPNGPSAKQRDRMGGLLLSAYRNYIPPVFLGAYAKLTDRDKRGPRARTKAVEPEFERWVVRQRVLDELLGRSGGSRGPYQKRIEREVGKTVKRVQKSVDAWSLDIPLLEWLAADRSLLSRISG